MILSDKGFVVACGGKTLINIPALANHRSICWTSMLQIVQ